MGVQLVDASTHVDLIWMSRTVDVKLNRLEARILVRMLYYKTEIKI